LFWPLDAPASANGQLKPTQNFAERRRVRRPLRLDPNRRSVPRREKAPRKVRARITVTDDWPDIVPVTEAELRVIEGHFGGLLDKLLGPRA